mmetsp:Transcript_13434/g.19219  ORF Transcript_13434/g.19219 Transcript_13434/m.19219 type:complete len:378 (+) Transcript_13434:124-1257(+)
MKEKNDVSLLNDKDEKYQGKNFANLLAGIAGGSVSTILTYPLDLIKVRLQVNEGRECEKKAARIRPSMFKTGLGVWKHEGLPGFYRGLGPGLFGSAASWGGYFYFYNGMKAEILNWKKKQILEDHSTPEIENKEQIIAQMQLGPLENFFAACSSGAIMVLFTNPVWLIKTRMQLQMKRLQEKVLMDNKNILHTDIKPPYKNMLDAFQTIIREEGPFALYKGAIPALMLVSHGGVQFVVYEFLKSNFGTNSNESRHKIPKNSQGKSSSSLSILNNLYNSIGYLTMGALSKIIASTTTYPLQVIKSRLQQRSHSIELSGLGDFKLVKREYAGLSDCVYRILEREGVYGFFKGCIPNALRVAPGAAITFVVYESVMDILS